MEKYVYNTNEDGVWDCNCLEEAVTRMYEDVSEESYELYWKHHTSITLYRGVPRPPQLAYYGMANPIIDLIEEGLYEQLGEAFEGDCLPVSTEQQKDLDYMLKLCINLWAEKHNLYPKNYYVVENIEEIYFTREEFEDLVHDSVR